MVRNDTERTVRCHYVPLTPERQFITPENHFNRSQSVCAHSDIGIMVPQAGKGAEVAEKGRTELCFRVVDQGCSCTRQVLEHR